MSQQFKQNEKGFTLIEMMIVIAIIGILAGIAIPNFLGYRAKSFCSVAEADANNIADAIADYFAIPSHTDLSTGALPTPDISIALTGNNTAAINGNINAIVITVVDGSGQCPDSYMDRNPSWTTATATYTKTIP